MASGIFAYKEHKYESHHMNARGKEYLSQRQYRCHLFESYKHLGEKSINKKRRNQARLASRDELK